MADKEITIKVSTEADTQEVDDLKTLLEQIENPNITVETDVDGAITDVESLQSEFEEATATVDELTQELANIELGVSDGDFDEVSLQLEEASQRANELGEALSNIDTTGLNDASTGADELNSSLQNASGSADELSSSMGLIESTMLMDMANQVGTLGDQAENTALDLENTAISMSQLSTNTGIADGELRNMISYISNETFPQSEAIAYANALNQMGVEASKLGDSATNMDRINDATGIGYSKVIQLTQGLRGLGVSADNLPSSFNAIAYAQANVTGGADTMSMVLKTQAGTLNEYGINVDQLVVILGRLSEMGYSGRKMGAELSSILKENNGDVRALEQSLGLQAGALSNASAKTGEYDGKLMDLANAEMENKTLTERLGAVWEDLSLQLEPVLSPLMSFMGLVGSIGQGALAINSILTLAETFGILETATISETFAQWGLNTAMLANPVTWLVVAIIVLIGVLIWAYYNCEDFRNAVNSLGEGFIWLCGVIYDSIMGAIEWAISEFQKFTDSIGLNANDWTQAVLGFILFLPQLPIRLGAVFVDAIARALGFKGSLTQTLYNAGVNAVNWFSNGISNLSSALWNELQGMLNDAQNFVGQIGQILWNAGVNAINNFLNGLQRHSPGKMQREFRAELTEMVDFVPYASDRLSGNIKKLSQNMVGSFTGFDFNGGDVEFSGTTNNDNRLSELIDTLIRLLPLIANNNPTVNIYGDVDNEERANKIIEIIRKELDWNNETAGRNVV